MIVTIIGSYKNAVDMVGAKVYFERFEGVTVNNPYSSNRPYTLLEKQMEWIKKIEEADLIVVIPKRKELEPKGGMTMFKIELGESTSYEFAIAKNLNKKIIFWESDSRQN